uniref:Calcineurin-like phosphoesterase domain-containing protein n=1 Tax=Neobodo designis TaxID=312471 RepID=A0A7S1KW85_NEODS|mmetsp:Transcript_10/g.29  ORF Transcript_10/g.29 Transcript_10/m.29 type:complete len:631 (+) Transcript_10:56-1948(+)|eukprot:CAMPEP_0174832652 /NCGR_PEP_ID=MMETSP1114-20130205/3786_1 /TAXON_ID=312471 /ORGANISM="Neobodo designis, Strain CCAP 1951/1" /LENGTH=630 /DNA_ID=CAMNT_0016066513 /DNA_START=56 /DNA_END=1948 /DNA_ORIENTATION=-
MTVWAIVLSFALCACCVHGLNFAVIGDFGMGGLPAGAVSEVRSAGALNEACRELQCNFTMSVGDNIYVGDVNKGLKDSFVASFDQTMPYFPSIGNHDNAGPQIEFSKRNTFWKFPGGYYTFTLPIDDSGYSVQIFAVNTMDGSLAGGGQYKWLDNELEHSNARWKLVFGHYPTVGSGRHRRSGSVSRIHQLLEKHNAQAYFCGHDHILEVSNVGGSILPISGAMSRGGMMLRGIGGGFRKWTLTNPSEFSTFKQDWPSHGFITGALSPNVLTLSFWDHYGGIMYELSTTWNWRDTLKQMQKDGTLTQKDSNEWAPAKIVHQAYKDEAQLEKGPGGATALVFDGSAIKAVQGAAGPAAPAPTLANGSTLAPTPAPPTTTVAPTTSGAPTPVPPTGPPETIAAALRNVTQAAEPMHNRDCGVAPAWSYVRFAVSGDCLGCTDDAIPAGEGFSLFISGYDVSRACTQLFLTKSPLGCSFANDANNAFMLEGTSRVTTPSDGNVFHFRTGVATPPTPAFVCLSADHGVTFRSLMRADHYVPSFHIVNPAGGSASVPTPAPVAGQQQGPPSTPVPQQMAANPPPAPTAAPASSGLSVGAVAVVALVCVVVGAGVSALVNRANWQRLESVANGSDE